MNSNNQMIQKGKISSVEGKADRNGDKTTARVLPSTADSMVTRPLTIPWYLRGEMGNLTPGTEVAYAMFEDGTGIASSRDCSDRLKRHLPGYDKGIDARKITRDRIDEAIRRARLRDNPPCADWPRALGGTTVYKLVENIL